MSSYDKEKMREYQKARRLAKSVNRPEDLQEKVKDLQKDLQSNVNPVTPPKPYRPMAIGDMIDQTAKAIEEAHPGHDKKAIAMAALARVAANESPEDRERRHSLPWEKVLEVCYDGKPLAQAMKEAGL